MGAVTAVEVTVTVTDDMIAAAQAEHVRCRADLDAEQSSAALAWDGSIDDQAAARLVLLSNRERAASARVAQLAKCGHAPGSQPHSVSSRPRRRGRLGSALPLTT